MRNFSSSKLPSILESALREANNALCNKTLPAETLHCNPVISGTNVNLLGTEYGESFQVFNLSNRDLHYVRSDGQVVSVAANYDGNSGLREFRDKLVIVHTQVHNIPSITLHDLANGNNNDDSESNGRAGIYKDIVYGRDIHRVEGSEGDFPYVQDMKKEFSYVLRNIRFGDHDNYMVYNPGNPRMSSTILNNNLKIVRLYVINVSELPSNQGFYSEYLNMVIRMTLSASDIGYIKSMTNHAPLFHPMSRVNAVRLFAEANGEFSTYGFYERIEIQVAPTYMEADRVFVVRNDEVKPLIVRKISGITNPVIAYSTKGTDGDIQTVYEPFTNENLAKYRVFRDEITALDFISNRERLEEQARLAKKENALKEETIANKQVDVDLQKAKAETIKNEMHNQQEKAKNNKTTEALKFIGTVISAVVVIVGGIFSIARSLISAGFAASFFGRFA